MPAITRTVAKGVAPRLRKPNPKPTQHQKKRNLNTNRKSQTQKTRRHKRAASDNLTESGGEGEETPASDDSVMSRKRRSKRRCVENGLESEEMVETVDNDSDMGHADEIEEVDDGSGEKAFSEDNGLNDHQRGANLEEVHTKKDLTLDLLTIMTDKVTVKFKIAPNEYVTEKGRWCNICKDDENFVRSHGKRKAFHKGGNSSCRLHIRQHYKTYKERCENADVPINHRAIPRNIWKAMEEEKEAKKRGRLTKKQQQQNHLHLPITSRFETLLLR
ncbi:hypothetical protein EDB84DRAFT_1591299 [Lactarius hengduanensis]|nr:hypothetical protein EDB84DRAFT_1591299 [Lactarius hengduanensis]